MTPFETYAITLILLCAVFTLVGFLIGWAVGNIFGYNEGVQQVARDQHINLCSTSEVPSGPTGEQRNVFGGRLDRAGGTDSSLVTRHPLPSPEVNS